MEFDSNFVMMINGQQEAGPAQMDVINPATAKPFAQCPKADEATLNLAVAAARAAFPGWKATPIADRKAALVEAGNRIGAHVDQFASLFTKEQGRPTELAKQEVMGASAWFHATAALDLPVDITEDNDELRVEVHHEPLGVVAGIVPWNFPMLLAAWKIAPALLTGNTLVLKPSPFTPLCTLKMVELIADLFPAGVINVISGGDELGPMMTSHPDINKISFTGSTATGKKVMESAAKDLKRITLELGGNDAAIVLPDVNPAKIAPQLFMGAFMNSAQICVANKRLYVHDEVYDDVRDEMITLINNANMGDGSEQGVMFGPIQNKPQYDRVMNLLEDAKASGLTLHQGVRPDGEGYFVPLTLVDNPPEDARVVAEEAFGPILPMMRFNDLDDVIGRANDTIYGLAGAVWSADLAKAREVASKMETGTVWINQNLTNTPMTPLAGHKQSGFGAENGIYGLMEFTVPKAYYLPKSTDNVT